MQLVSLSGDERVSDDALRRWNADVEQHVGRLQHEKNITTGAHLRSPHHIAWKANGSNRTNYDRKMILYYQSFPYWTKLFRQGEQNVTDSGQYNRVF